MLALGETAGIRHAAPGAGGRILVQNTSATIRKENRLSATKT